MGIKMIFKNELKEYESLFDRNKNKIGNLKKTTKNDFKIKTLQNWYFQKENVLKEKKNILKKINSEFEKYRVKNKLAIDKNIYFSKNIENLEKKSEKLSKNNKNVIIF